MFVKVGIRGWEWVEYVVERDKKEMGKSRARRKVCVKYFSLKDVINFYLNIFNLFKILTCGGLWFLNF